LNGQKETKNVITNKKREEKLLSSSKRIMKERREDSLFYANFLDTKKGEKPKKAKVKRELG